MCALLCFLACKLVGTCCYLYVKNIDGAQLYVATTYLFYSKRGAGKGKRWGPHAAVRARASALGEGAGRECAAVLMVVGSAHAPLPGIGQSERARGISSGHMMLMPCGAG